MLVLELAEDVAVSELEQVLLDILAHWDGVVSALLLLFFFLVLPHESLLELEVGLIHHSKFLGQGLVPSIVVLSQGEWLDVLL